MRLLLSLPLLVAALPASADEIRLANGSTLRGRIIERSATHVVVEVGPGRVTLPASRIASVESGTTALDRFRERAAALAPGDAAAWLSLGLWARDQGLHTQAREAFERVVLLQPANPIANAALGRVRHGEGWLSREDSYRAQGLVNYRGRWITPAELEVALAERSAAAQERTARAEAAARVREAEARAAEAEARAAAAAAAPPGPWGPGAWGVFVGGPFSGHGGRSPVPRQPPPEPPPRPAPTTRSIR